MVSMFGSCSSAEGIVPDINDVRGSQNVLSAVRLAISFGNVPVRKKFRMDGSNFLQRRQD
jgi:hypothetical protein